MINDDQHVARYCPRKAITSSGRITGAAFELREIDKGRFSVNWTEYLGLDSRKDEIDHLSVWFCEKMKGDLSKTRIAILNVGNTKAHVLEASERRKLIEFHHRYNINNPSHASIESFELDEFTIFAFIAESIIKSYPVVIR